MLLFTKRPPAASFFGHWCKRMRAIVLKSKCIGFPLSVRTRRLDSMSQPGDKILIARTLFVVDNESKFRFFSSVSLSARTSTRTFTYTFLQ